MVDHTFGPARGARCIVERKTFPLITGHDPSVTGIPLGNKLFILKVAATGGITCLSIGYFDDLGGGAFQRCNCCFDGR